MLCLCQSFLRCHFLCMKNYISADRFISSLLLAMESIIWDWVLVSIMIHDTFNIWSSNHPYSQACCHFMPFWYFSQRCYQTSRVRLSECKCGLQNSRIFYWAIWGVHCWTVCTIYCEYQCWFVRFHLYSDNGLFCFYSWLKNRSWKCVCNEGLHISLLVASFVLSSLGKASWWKSLCSQFIYYMQYCKT